MDWDELKDWKVIGVVITVTSGFGRLVAWLVKTSKDTVEIVKAKAETKKINAETKKIESGTIDEMRDRINRLNEDLWIAQREVEKLQRTIDVYKTFIELIKK